MLMDLELSSPTVEDVEFYVSQESEYLVGRYEEHCRAIDSMVCTKASQCEAIN